MAEKLVVVCDECGRPAQEAVTFRIGNRSLAKDLCASHVQELVRNAHPPRRGRRPTAALPAATPKRRGSPSPKPPGEARPRRPITDPATLEKRRASLEKARRALARKRAAAKKAT